MTTPTHDQTAVRAAATQLLCAALLGLPAASAWAAEARVGTQVTAIDIDYGFFSDSASGVAGPLQGTLPVLSRAAGVASGIVTSGGQVAADAYTAQLRAVFSSTVNIDENPRAGRGGSASGTTSVQGSITLAGPVAGMATFSGVVEGSYNFGNSPFRFNNTAYIDFQGIVGGLYRGIDTTNFDPFSSAGLFSMPITWTVAVQPDMRLDMDFSLHGEVRSTVGTTVIDLSNTFKLTSMVLPDGYSYTPDADGFLSQFTPAAVPEPASSALLLAGLVALAWRSRWPAPGVNGRWRPVFRPRWPMTVHQCVWPPAGLGRQKTASWAARFA